MAYKIEGLIVLSNTISSEELASYKLPVVTIERECDHVCSVSTDNYLGGVQATSLLIRNKCDVILHINSIFQIHFQPMDVSGDSKISVTNTMSFTN